MIEHWQAIATGALVGIFAILSRYLFVMKKDCADHRQKCNMTICGKINDLQNRSSAASIQAIALDNEAKSTLKEINAAILLMNKEISELHGAFNRFLKEFDKQK